MTGPPCGSCGRAQVGPKRPGDCHWCHLALNHVAYRSWHPDPEVRAAHPPKAKKNCSGSKMADAVRAALTTLATGGQLRVPKDGPGTELKELLASVGLEPVKGCSCNKRMQQMNAWGPVGCVVHKDLIVDWLRKEAKKRSWVEKLKAARLAVANGLAFKLNPLDPAPGLFNEAIRRSMKKGEASHAV